jgi:hypothetical protein
MSSANEDGDGGDNGDEERRTKKMTKLRASPPTRGALLRRTTGEVDIRTRRRLTKKRSIDRSAARKVDRGRGWVEIVDILTETIGRTLVAGPATVHCARAGSTSVGCEGAIAVVAGVSCGERISGEEEQETWQGEGQNLGKIW